jgi:hypothetical protein
LQGEHEQTDGWLIFVAFAVMFAASNCQPGFVIYIKRKVLLRDDSTNMEARKTQNCITNFKVLWDLHALGNIQNN